MVRYFLNYEELAAVLKRTKTLEEGISIVNDLETRRCPMHWINAAWSRCRELER